MDMSLFKKDGKTFTRFKVPVKSFGKYRLMLEVKYGVDTTKPVKISSRYKYFEKKGDWINGKM